MKKCSRARSLIICPLLILFVFLVVGQQCWANSASEYKQAVLKRLKDYWASAELNKGQVQAEWTIKPDGSIATPILINNKFGPTYEKAVFSAIRLAAPYAPPPTEKYRIRVFFGPAKPLGMSVISAADKYGPAARERLKIRLPGLRTCPGGELRWVFFKNEMKLHIFAKDSERTWKELGSFAVRSASGKLGPKLREGDMQVPEGIYRISSIEAHNKLLLGVNYPNDFDRFNANKDKRKKLGYGIQIHGGCYSTGCVVLSNPDMEELWILAHDVGSKNILLIFSPCDLRKQNAPLEVIKEIKWSPKLYEQIKKALPS